jgi:DNA-binding beta-propeller fold protein YncE
VIFSHRLLYTLALVGVLAALVPAAAGAQSSYVFATTTDFSTGCASQVTLGPPRTAQSCVELLSSDPVARWAFGKIYVVNRFGFDNIQILDPGNGFQTEFQFSVGNGTNPQDIAVLSPTKAYVSRLGSSSVLIVNPTTGATLGTVSLTAFADGDGLPEAHKMLLYGDRVFLSLQRLDNFAPTDSSFVVIIDAAADTLIDADPLLPGTQGILLTGSNPNTDLVLDPTSNRILVGETGAFGVADGGVEAIDPIALEALGYESTETQLGGDLNDVAVAPNGRAYVVVSDVSFNALLVRYDRATGALADTLLNPGGFSIGDVEVNDRGELWVCDRTFAAPGLRVFDTADDMADGGLIDVGLPPFDIVFDAVQVVATEPPAPDPGSGLRLVSRGANPSRTGLHLRFSVSADQPRTTRLRIFDVRGAEVARVDAGELGEGLHRLDWEPGGRLAAGVYLYLLEYGTERIGGRVTLLR